MFDYAKASEVTPLSTSLLERVRDATRAEAQAAAERLISIYELYRLRLRETGECAEYAVDTWDTVAAQVAATLRVSPRKGASYLRYAAAMREDLPKVGAVFEAGDLDYTMFQMIVFRTGLLTVDRDLLARVDTELAAAVPRWKCLGRKRIGDAIDKRIAALDPDAVRRGTDYAAERYVEIGETEPGMAEVRARLFNTTALALDRRLNELAGTVCSGDPRNHDQRRADAMDVLIAGGDQLACGCDNDPCPAAGKRRPPGTTQIHVVAERATLEGRSQTPAQVAGAEWLIPAEVLRELAVTAKQVPIIAPDAAEAGYVPSKALAAFVRARDLTCRAPGCDKPAVFCELDHTIPHPHGPTHPSNLKCLCKLHHLLKTFGGWRDEQLPDGTVIWTLPGDEKHVTTPGSALLFPSLCFPTARLPELGSPAFRASMHSAKMPRRQRTRRQARADAIAVERSHNQADRLTREAARKAAAANDPPTF